ncbi:CLUMA_CG010741, isoform A [Clunio marinus]|uniref:CLUMA_CG010741, isoform A n=1 Tax=Clunio marinus TaxID=568069 RepID=A0A1J1IEC3_9DIPT|nr:CLUMA_CG010741, isoform A [Clunio marinus]
MSRLVFCAYSTFIISIIIQAASLIDKCPSVTDFPSTELRSFSEEDFAWQYQKSLVIAFDTTGSMEDDLEQLREAAIVIVNELSEREDNVIENYILSLFNDPYVAEPFVTTDPSELIARLNEVVVNPPNSDCPEPAMQGMKNALEVAYPNSLVFVFTDASAKDFELFDDVADVAEPFVTTDPSELIARLNKVTVSGGGDCPELAMLGIKNALEVAYPNSLVFVFTDASAKDFELFDDVAGLIQLKQIRAYFLLTGNCGDSTAPGYQVFERIARVSDGQVFNMNRDEVRDVMLAIRFVLDPGFVSLFSLDFEEAGSNSTDIAIDPSFTSVSVALSGMMADLTVRDASGDIPSGELFSATNIKIMTIPASNTVLTVEASAESAYSIRITGISAIQFRFGFSSSTPRNLNETQILPLRSQPNILSIFASNPLLINCMFQVSFIPVDDDFQVIDMELKRTSSDVYSTNVINIPSRPFKIMAYGVDTEGNEISRLLSTGIGITTVVVSCSTKCAIDGTGFVPFKYDCSRYYVCIKGVQHARSCPIGEAFDVSTSSCVSSTGVRCFRDSCLD